MKKIKIIIATFCVAAIGAGIFVSCEKESINDNTLASNPNKIQKDMSDAFYEYEDEPDVYYWANDTDRIPILGLPSPKRDKARGEGSVVFNSYGRLIDIHCQYVGNTCGDAEWEYGDATRVGIWVHYQDPYDGMQWKYAYKWD